MSALKIITPAVLCGLIASPAMASEPYGDWYAQISVGVSAQGDSDNSGAFAEEFSTGAGTTIDAGTALAAGTPVNWTTTFDYAPTGSIAFGRRFDSVRTEIELSYSVADVDKHKNVRAGDTVLTNEDAAVLITGQNTPLDLTVGELVADGQGQLKNGFVFANAYYDFDTGTDLTPYVGIGLGIAFADVEYRPSATQIVSDKESGVAWQLMGGASYRVMGNQEIFGGLRYRQGADIDTSATLLPADLDIENTAIIAEAGFRLEF